MPANCHPEVHQLLLRLRLFQGLNDMELAHLNARADFLECGPGECLIREGEQGHQLFILLAGQARISKRAFGMEKVIQKLGPGECFGEMSLLDNKCRSASVKTIDHCKLLRLDGDYVVSLPEISSKIYRNLAFMLSQKLRHANEILTLG
jgi:CRP/FNR family cyclic AMP-dependent transcriptional regulator